MQRKTQKRLLKDRFVNKIVVVTGSARGIGKNIACAFGREKAHIVICDIDERKGEATVSELCKEGLSVEFLCADLSQKGIPQSMIQQIVKRCGRLDILINNVRSGQHVSLLEENEDTWEEGISVMLRAAFFASQEAIRAMSKTGGGNIVNISSVLALLVGYESPIYHICKAGLLQMTRYFALHAGKYGVRVNAVLPGFIVKDEKRAQYESEDNQQYRRIAEFCHPMGYKYIGKADDVANTMLFLCSEEASFISGQYIVIDGGLSLQDQFGLLHEWEKKNIK